MAYLRWGEKLPSGGKSNSYIFGDPDGLINMDKGTRVLYQDIRNLFKNENDAVFQK